jgi:hypothetical protein
MKLNRGVRGVMFKESRDCLIGNRLRRFSQPTISGKARRPFSIFGDKEDACAGTRCGDALRLNVRGHANVAEARLSPVGHALRNMGGQVCGNGAASDSPQRAAHKHLERLE